MTDGCSYMEESIDHTRAERFELKPSYLEYYKLPHSLTGGRILRRSWYYLSHKKQTLIQQKQMCD